jgi:hypothetical protein
MKLKCILSVTLIAASVIGCGDGSPTAPGKLIEAQPITRVVVFVRNSPDEYVELDLTRKDGESTLVMFRPPQPNSPRIVLDSIGPDSEEPPEMVELLKKFDVWAMADSNAAGAACSTKSGQWICNHTFNDYSLVVYVVRNGTFARSQRYTGLNLSTGHPTARALGDYVFAWSRKVQGLLAERRVR